MKKISIGICCYNEEENIELMYQAVTEQMKKLPVPRLIDRYLQTL